MKFVETGDEAGGVRVLRLNRPPANAITLELLQDLETACQAAAGTPEVRAVVVTGSGKFFSAGLDLRALSTDAGARLRSGRFGSGDGLSALWTLPKPTVAMINGHAVAAGGVIALACDFRVSARGPFKIGLNETAIGLAFPLGAFEVAQLALTSEQARRVMLEAGLHEPDRARELGLVDEVVEADDLKSTCLERARRLGRYPAQAYAHTKEALQRAAVERVRNETDAARRAVVDVWSSPETVQTLMAQLADLGRK